MEKVELNFHDNISVPQAAKYLGVGRKVVYKLLEYGELRAVREGGKIYIDPCSLRAFKADRKMV